MTDLKKLRDLAGAATKEWESDVWCADPDYDCGWAACGPVHQSRDEDDCGPGGPVEKKAQADAAFIAAANPTTVLALLDRLDELTMQAQTQADLAAEAHELRLKAEGILAASNNCAEGATIVSVERVLAMSSVWPTELRESHEVLRTERDRYLKALERLKSGECTGCGECIQIAELALVAVKG